MTFLYRLLYPSLIWRIESKEKNLYLTFDDGPIPVVTEWVLKILKEYNAQATFFCIGDNVLKHPDIYHLLLASGHSTGNHSMNHMNGWKTADDAYVSNVVECSKHVSSGLFRPPYGRIKHRQISLLKNYKIIMWDVLSKDYDRELTGEECFARVKRQATSGSIIVFHDSLKAEPRLRYALPATLEYFSKKGFAFKALSFG